MSILILKLRLSSPIGRCVVSSILGEEDEANAAKLARLGKKDSVKHDGSLVVYLTKACDAERLLHDWSLHFEGQSEYTRVYK